ncbi:Pimeloyl-ACP methyl ester carboxylesterase [Jatrophihabitans endophyticus]|uniref:Pimeloyl-ACP methyl ester carboxylesterase n=1 Tax=Jatrophihabitans endophyticus TaxID=1206085 RepID=A0A1M5NA77_9ACTN|nr:alpha/beta hydrolase [Jatrophihabitans endophyticus]SHG85903.1 Pimeloyl-ACP methyl ester carboxylesterase [Jatrophihabitans endophyticus]
MTRLRQVDGVGRTPVVRIESRVVHGYRRAFRIAGDGPPLLLVHGIGDSSAAWRTVIPDLARTHTVIAPDLLGHGHSARPRADYSVAAYANGMRDLLGVLGVDEVTLVGHSLGGGVAMQFAYQFPEKTQRLVLVASGGAGTGVSPLLRGATLPGAQALLAALRLPMARLTVNAVIGLLARLDTVVGLDAVDLRRVVSALPDATARAAFIRTLRAVVDWRGQVVTMLDRCYLARAVPTLLVWGTRDSVLPIGHAYQAHAAMPGSRLEIFEGAGHFPFRTDPRRFVAVLEDFLATTTPGRFGVEDWRVLLREGRPAAVRRTEAPGYRDQLRLASERSAT